MKFKGKLPSGPAARNLGMLAISLVLGGIGVLVTKGFIENKIKEASATSQTKKEVMVEVVVPRAAMLRGQVITPDALAARWLPARYVDSNTVRPDTFNIAVGQRLNFDIDGGKPLLWAHLEGGVMPTFSGKIPEGFRALTVPVDEINSISGFLQPKDNVDLLITYAGKEVGGKKVTRPFMQNLHVLATGVQTAIDKTGRSSGARYGTITVQVTPEEAKRIILARDVGKITAVLRHPDDAAPMADSEMNVSKLFGKEEVAQRKPVARKKGIEYIIGGL